MTDSFIVAEEVLYHDTTLDDAHGRRLWYRTTIEALADAPDEAPRTWRVQGQQVRGDKPVGRRSPARHVYSVNEARTLARALFRRHLRYVEKRVALARLRAEVAKETLEEMFQGY